MPNKRTIPRICCICGIAFMADPANVKRGGGLYHSPACQAIGARVPIEDRFWPRVDQNGPVPPHVPHLGPCWIWTGYRNREGRGFVTFNGVPRLAAVVAYVLSAGHEPRPETPCVLHHCDGGTIGCVRPSHLFVGTHGDNVADKVSKNRQGKGALITQAKLNDDQAREILLRWEQGGITQRTLATEYGVNQAQISRLIRRKSWTHIA